MRRTLTFITAALLLWPALASAQQDDGGLYGQLDGTVALLSDTPERSFFTPGLGYNVRIGWRGDTLGAFAQAGQATWFGTALDAIYEPGVFNAGLGVEARYLDGRARSSLAGGTSTLLFDTALDEAGSTGWFASLRPIGMRWLLSERFAMEFAPITFNVMQPVTTAPRLTRVEYQAVLALELR